MKTLGFVAVILLVCVAGVVRADVVAGNMFSNSDLNTDLTGWLQAGGGSGTCVWSNLTGTYGYDNALDTVKGGMLITKDWEVQNASPNTFTFGATGTKYYLSFVAGSPDHSAGGNGILARMGRAVSPWTTANPNGGYQVTPAKLNAGWAEYLNYEFTVISSITGMAGQIWLDTYGTQTDSMHYGIDRVVLTTSPIAAGSLYQPTPEPGTLVLAIMGMIGLVCYAWRKRR